MLGDAEFTAKMWAEKPILLSIARNMLRRNPTISPDDMVQDTMLRAWAARHRFDGRFIGAWLTTILRNCVISAKRRAWRECELDQEAAEATPSASDQQEWSAALSEALAMLRNLPKQTVSMLIEAAEGADYEELAEKHSVNIGTVKSTLNRARRALSEASC
ncbi:MAG: RNA polymerase sigma factor [Hyphomonadaceae bacterium]